MCYLDLLEDGDLLLGFFLWECGLDRLEDFGRLLKLTLIGLDLRGREVQLGLSIVSTLASYLGRICKLLVTCFLFFPFESFFTGRFELRPS